MGNTTTAKSGLPYVQRLLEDEFVQEQLRNAASGARAVYASARRERSKAADDKALYRNLRQAATSIRNAAMALRRPEPPKRRVRKAAIIGLAIGGCALLTKKLQKLQSQPAPGAGTSPAQGGSSYKVRDDAPESIHEPSAAAAHTAN